MVLAFGPGQQFRNVVVIETLTQPHRAGLGAVGLRRGRGQHLVETDAEGLVDDDLERLAKLAGPALRLATAARPPPRTPAKGVGSKPRAPRERPGAGTW